MAGVIKEGRDWAPFVSALRQGAPLSGAMASRMRQVGFKGVRR